MKTKICLVLNSPAGGGAERFLIQLANNLSRELFDIHLILLKKEGEYFHLIRKDIIISDLNIQSFALNKPINPLWVWKLGKEIKRIGPKLVFSTMGSTNLMNMLAKAIERYEIPIVIREALNLSDHLSSDRLALIKRNIYKICLPLSDMTVFLTQVMADDLERYLHLTIKKKAIIPNFLDTEYLEAKICEPWPGQLDLPMDKKIIVSLGRLEKQKGFDVGIRAFSELQKEMPSYYWILGQGPEEKNLKNLAQQLGVTHLVRFLGFQRNPFVFIKQAGVFLLSSRAEGFPNALLEAMYCGVPCVTTRYSSFSEDLIQDQKEGLVVPNEDHAAMATAIKKILKNPALADQLKHQAQKKALQFTKEKIVQRYEQLFLELAVD